MSKVYNIYLAGSDRGKVMASRDTQSGYETGLLPNTPDVDKYEYNSALCEMMRVDSWYDFEMEFVEVIK